MKHGSAMTKVVRERDVAFTELESPKKDRFPRIVILIIIAEFCERFSYSGMKAFLTIYLRSKLGYTDDGATEIYHVFSCLVYFFPIIGGIVADNYLGKFRTILYMMFVYAAGNILVAVTAIPQLNIPARLCTMIGLLMITIGTGGIKPCVTSFGGDQFKLPRQEHHLAVYFSILYFSICIGSLIAKTVSPILRSEVYCFGDKDCYSLAFGAPGLVVLLSMVIFVSAKSRYVMKKPEGNTIVDFVKCISLGIKNKILKRGKTEKNSHWLDSTQDHFDRKFINDIKRTLSILVLYTVLPVFWALLDQMGSRWSLQATKMDGRFGYMTVKPDQVQVVAPIFILILIPISQKYIYPFLERRNMLKNPLHKLTLGGILAGIAFIASGAVEIYIKTTYPVLPIQGESQLRIYNGNPCEITIENQLQNINYSIPSYALFHKDIPIHGTEYLDMTMKGICVEKREERLLLEEEQSISFFLMGDELVRFKDNVDKSKSGFPFVRFLISSNSSVTLYNERRNEIECHLDVAGVSRQMEVFTSTYSLRSENVTLIDTLELESGGVYTILVGPRGNKQVQKVFVTTEPNSITMALLFPQFFIMSIAEVLFAVTGNEFSFKEAPESMKAVMTSVWLLTEAMGNVLIIIITRLSANIAQENQFFMYTGLMFVSIAMFHYLSRGYRFKGEGAPRRVRSGSEQMYAQVKSAEDCLEH